MARQIIDVESPIPNTTPQRYGEPPKTAFEKVNAMTDELYTGMALAGNVGTEPPADPVLGQFWGDTSVTPAMVRRWDGTQWVEIQPLFATLGSAAYCDAIGTEPLYGRDSVLGFVGQSGGVPTNALMQVGQTSNGVFWRYADGSLVTQSFSTPLVYTSSNNLGATHTFPAIFDSSIIQPIPEFMIYGGIAGLSPLNDGPLVQRVTAISNTSVTVNLTGDSGRFATGDTVSVLIRTKGRFV